MRILANQEHYLTNSVVELILCTLDQERCDAFRRKTSVYSTLFTPSDGCMGVCLKSTASKNITVRSSSVISYQQTNHFNIENMRQGPSLDKI